MQMCHSGVDTIRYQWAPQKSAQYQNATIVDRSFTFRNHELLSMHCAHMLWFCTFHRTISWLYVDFEYFKLALWPTLRQKFMNFWSFLTCPADKHDDKISNCSLTPKLVQAHNSAVSVTIFFLYDYKTDLISWLGWNIILKWNVSLFIKIRNVLLLNQNCSPHKMPRIASCTTPWARPFATVLEALVSDMFFKCDEMS